MSPLWRDEVGIFVGPGKVVLARMQRGIRPRCTAEQGISVDNAIPSEWRPALEALDEQLKNKLWQGARVRVVVSDHWARYAVIPWSSRLTRDSERLAHARLVLSNTYGDLIEEWTLCMSQSKPNEPAIVSAIPRDLLRDLNDLLPPRNLQLKSVQPHLIVAYNSWRDRLPATASWFASIDDGSLAAMHLTDGKCDRVRSVRISDDWSVEIRRIQTMGRLAQSRVTEGRVFVDAPAWLRNVADRSNAAVEWLDDGQAPRNIADKVTLLKGMYT